MDRARLVATLQRISAALPASVVAVYLFGSRARGEERADSDVDLAIVLQGSYEPRLVDEARTLEARVEEQTGLVTGVVVATKAPADLLHRVLRDGVVVLDRDRAARLRFEVQARNEYFDLEPLRRLYRRSA